MFFFGIFMVASFVLIEWDHPITGIVIGPLSTFFLGVPSLLTYKDFWYSIDPEDVFFRPAFSGGKRIRFVDIVSKEVIQRQGGDVLRIQDSYGTRFRISVSLFDILPTLARFGFYDQFQR